VKIRGVINVKLKKIGSFILGKLGKNGEVMQKTGFYEQGELHELE
jgi:hypothetical protein